MSSGYLYAEKIKDLLVRHTIKPELDGFVFGLYLCIKEMSRDSASCISLFISLVTLRVVNVRACSQLWNKKQLAIN